MNNLPPSPGRLCPPVKHPLPRLLDVVIVYLHKMPRSQTTAPNTDHLAQVAARAQVL
ncbi:hypothetical protein P692DRAFT_20838835 [Suillus brevipes Sb2]|nr:hypothetical protein P692DRAFT_20838835 [Suillus brevipes Sb2]